MTLISIYLYIEICYQHAYWNMVEEEFDGKPWLHDIKIYLQLGECLFDATSKKKNYSTTSIRVFLKRRHTIKEDTLFWDI